MPGAVLLNAGPITEYIPRPFEKPGHGFVGPQQGTTGERDNGVQYFILERWLTEKLGSVEFGGCAYILAESIRRSEVTVLLDSPEATAGCFSVCCGRRNPPPRRGSGFPLLPDELLRLIFGRYSIVMEQLCPQLDPSHGQQPS